MRFCLCSPYYSTSTVTGANRRFDELCKLAAADTSLDFVCVVPKGNKPPGIKNERQVIYIPQRLLANRLLTYLYLNYLFLFRLVNWTIVSDFNPVPISCFCLKRHVLLVHDARAFDSYGRWSVFSSIMMKSFWRMTRKIVTVSEFSKKRLVSCLQKSSDDVIVSYNGISSSLVGLVGDSIKRDVDFLYVATFEPRKNHKVLVDAIAKSSILRRASVVLVGKDLGGRKEIDQLILAHGLSGVTIIDSISEDALRLLYNRARVFVSPSSYEGFGIPLIEAAIAGCRIVCSDIEVFREIMGGYATYFDCSSSGALSMVLEGQLGDEPVYNSSKINDEVSSFMAKFSWPAIYAELLFRLRGHVSNGEI